MTHIRGFLTQTGKLQFWCTGRRLDDDSPFRWSMFDEMVSRAWRNLLKNPALALRQVPPNQNKSNGGIYTNSFSLQSLISFTFLTNQIKAKFVVVVCKVFDTGCHLHVIIMLLTEIVKYISNIYNTPYWYSLELYFQKNISHNFLYPRSIETLDFTFLEFW